MTSQRTNRTPSRLAAVSGGSSPPQVVVLISADIEWQVVNEIYPQVEIHTTPVGGWFTLRLGASTTSRDVIFLHGGWGKIAAAASTQYAIDHWRPDLLVNLGTCGGFDGQTEKGEIILVDRTVVYDIVEQMGDFDTHIEYYVTEMELAWLEEDLPTRVRRGVLASADRDLFYDEIPGLVEKYGAVAGDWESGAIAWVAARNQVPCLILRGVSDIVCPQGSEAYGDLGYFLEGTRQVMEHLLTVLPAWLDCA